jgi:hypothetical protein
MEKNMLIILITLIFLSVTQCAAATVDITTATRTITPSYIRTGGSFDVTVEIIISDETTFLGTLEEKYTSSESMKKWVISNVDADSVFRTYIDGVAGTYQWSGGMMDIPQGTYYVSYTVTVPDDVEEGVYSISGRWVDEDHESVVSGDNTITVGNGQTDVLTGDTSSANYQSISDDDKSSTMKNRDSGLPVNNTNVGYSNTSFSSLSGDYVGSSLPKESPSLYSIWILMAIILLALLEKR